MGRKWEDFYKERDIKYPLHRYFALTQDDSKPVDHDAIGFLSQYICDTRTLGGAFVWPTDSIDGGGSSYNASRGVGCYIEDRADLTLLEAKCYFEGKKIFSIDKEITPILCSHTCDNESQMYKFFELFRGETGEESFMHFVKFFMFESFVDVDDNFTPIDITTGKAFKLNDGGTDYIIGKRLSEIDLDAEGLKKILERVQKIVIERTRAMEAILPQV